MVAADAYFAEAVICRESVQLGAVPVLDRAVPAKVILLGLGIKILLRCYLVVTARLRLRFARRLISSFQDFA